MRRSTRKRKTEKEASKKRVSRRIASTMLLGGILLCASFLSGMFVYKNQLPPVPQLRELRTEIGELFASPTPKEIDNAWFVPRSREQLANDEKVLSEEQAAEIVRLQALGYVSGSAPKTDRVNVVRYDPSRSYDGYNLYNDGHDTVAVLLDMKGRVLHQWSLKFKDAFPNRKISEEAKDIYWWRRVGVTSNGELFAIYEGQGMVKVSWDSKLIWAYSGLAHHDFELLPTGDIYVLTRKAEMFSQISEKKPTLIDYITLLDADGNEKRRISIMDAILSSEYRSLRGLMADGGDVLHTNTLEVLDGTLSEQLPAFKSGNILISMRSISTIAILDPTQEKVVWAMSGWFDKQHQPTLLKNGHILLFDNQGDLGKSRVLEIDVSTQTVVWECNGRKADFYSKTCGSVQRLPNGNTLITQSNSGGAMEVTRDGDVVWEFFTPHRAGENDEFTAALFELQRIETQFLQVENL